MPGVGPPNRSSQSPEPTVLRGDRARVGVGTGTRYATKVISGALEMKWREVVREGQLSKVDEAKA